MEENKVYFRHLMLFYYRKGENATQAINKISALYGESTLAERTVRKWFAMLSLELVISILKSLSRTLR